jgi:capsular polysaccharide biosynthesis protein
VELRYLVGIVLRRWWLVAIPVIIAALFSLPDILNRSALTGGYNAALTFTAFQDMDAIPRQNGDYNDLWQASELLVNALSDWSKGLAFKDEIAAVAALSGVEINTGALAIASDDERSIGQIYFTYPDAEILTTIVDSAINVLSNQNGEYFPQLGGVNASVTILSQSDVSAAAPPLLNRFSPIVKIGLGLLAGIGLALLAYYLDPNVRRRDDLDSLGVTVLAAIPRRS